MAKNSTDINDKLLSCNPVVANVGYFSRTSRPVYALLFLLPFIIIYEVLVLAVNPQLLTESATNVRGGVVAFVWVQNFLHYLGMDMKIAWLFAPLTVIVTLLTLQFTSGQSWKIKLPDFVIMTSECIVLAVPLIILALVLNRSPRTQPAANSFGNITTCQNIAQCQADQNQTCQPENGSRNNHNFSRRTIAMELLTGIGAGIYEELIFRLVLISAAMMFLEVILGINRTKAIFISVVISSVLFSLYHHFVFLNGQFAKAEIFTITRFAFRTIAGVFFAIIFAIRGFGIAAGTHSFYDIMATLLNAWLFERC